MKDLIILARDIGFKPKTITTQYTFDSYFNSKKIPFVTVMCNYILLYEIQTWLRNKYKIDIIVGSDILGYIVYIWNRNIFKKLKLGNVNIFETYEEALEFGVHEVLKYYKNKSIEDDKRDSKKDNI